VPLSAAPILRPIVHGGSSAAPSEELGGAGGVPNHFASEADCSIEVLREIPAVTFGDISVEIVDECIGSVLLTSYEQDDEESSDDGTRGVEIYSRGERIYPPSSSSDAIVD
jgi:hypothetical protein